VLGDGFSSPKNHFPSYCSIFLIFLDSFRSWQEIKMNMSAFSRTHNTTHSAATISSIGNIPSLLLHREGYIPSGLWIENAV
jgi:hypothetical protein